MANTNNSTPDMTTQSASSTTLTIESYLGPHTECDNIKLTPQGHTKPVNCSVWAVYTVTLNSDAPRNLCPQCTTAIEDGLVA